MFLACDTAARCAWFLEKLSGNVLEKCWNFICEFRCSPCDISKILTILWISLAWYTRSTQPVLARVLSTLMLSTSTSTYVPSGLSTSKSTEIRYSSTTSTSTQAPTLEWCDSKLTIIGLDNGLSPDQRQAIIWTSAGILLLGPLGTNFSEILIKIHSSYIFIQENVVWKMVAILSQPQCANMREGHIFRAN